MPVPVVPAALQPVIEACAAAGGRPLLVGGCVRDAWMGTPQKDVDIEVHGISLETLRTVLRKSGHVSEVGRSFGVLKLRIGSEEFDFSLPRRDSKIGAGHRGIQVQADPEMGVEAAARRRDLTVNAVGFDPLAQRYEDPFDGLGDIDRGLLRAVDPTTFAEDPLRALRVVQFAARFGFAADPELVALCAAMGLDELPAERITGEVEKFLLLGKKPSEGWSFALRANIWARVLPEWDRPCPPQLDRIAQHPPSTPAHRFAVMLASTVDFSNATALMDRLRLHRWRGFALRAQVLALTAARDEALEKPSDFDIQRWAETMRLDLCALLLDQPELYARAAALGVSEGPLPPLLTGGTAVGLGVPPGPALGALLNAVRDAQLRGEISTPEAAREWALRRLG